MFKDLTTGLTVCIVTFIISGLVFRFLCDNQDWRYKILGMFILGVYTLTVAAKIL